MATLPVCLVAAFASGIALALVSGIAAGVPLAVLVLASIGAAATTRCRRPGPTLVLGAAGLVAAGAALGTHADARARDPVLARFVEPPGAVAIVGTLVEDASIGPAGVRLRITPQSVNGVAVAPGEAIALTVGGTVAEPLVGDWLSGRLVRTTAAVRRPARYLNPGVPDDQLALARRGLTLVGSVKSGALVEVLSLGGWRQESSAAVRRFVRQSLATHVASHDPTAAAVATAILIGDRAGLSAELEQRLQAAGTYHVIAISGGNIAVLTVTLLAGARLARIPPAAAGAGVAVLLVAHASLVGSGPSVMRATTMAVIYLGLRIVDQSAWSVNALAAACGALLLASPMTLVDPGFLLSAAATAAIVLLASRLSKALPLAGWRRAAAGIVAASAATEVVLLPISATLFNRITVAGVVLNLAAVPLMTVVQLSASITVMFAGVLPAAADLSGTLTAWAARWLVDSASLIDLMPWMAIRVPPPPWPIAATYLMAVLLLTAGSAATVTRTAFAVRLRRPTLIVAVGAAFVILSAPTTWRWPWRANGRLAVVALDVGQGDASVIEFPDGRRWLVDAGGLAGSTRYDIGERVVAPALWARGIGRLEAMLLTHGDPDHIGGAAAVLEDFRPTVLDGIPVPAHTPLRRLSELAARRGRAWTTVKHGDHWTVGGVTVIVWHPPLPDWERQRVRNDDSVVLELRFGDVSVVLPGDIGAEVERQLAPQMEPARMRVVKAAHHGSASSTSDEWLDALRPDIVFISCGRDNRYGHPARAVRARLAARGIPTFRTDDDGQIVIETDGNAVLTRTFSGRHHTTTKPRSREATKRLIQAVM